MVRFFLILYCIVFFIPTCLSAQRSAHPDSLAYVYSPEEVKKAGYMLLVNKSHRLPDGYVPKNLKYANSVVRCERPDTYLDSIALGYLKQMFNAAKQEDIELIFYDGWRPESLQRQYYVNKIKERGHSLATTLVAPPRGSEHELGLAADILSTVHQMRDGHYARTKTGKWLIENCWKYGFILRYPADKIEITRFLFEPWHYRFVGIPEAQQITESGYCLEEYLKTI